MKIRLDSTFFSSVLFTVALVCLVPWFARAVLADQHNVVLHSLDPDFRAAADRFLSDVGVASLAIISIGLIVTWTGYVNRVWWTWFVMFIIVWVWAFPLLALPLLQYPRSLGWSEWIYSAIYQPGLPRVWAESVLIFILMVIALFLPLKAFVSSRRSPEPIRMPSLRRIAFSATLVSVVVIAVLVWIHTRVYILTPAELNSWQQFPPPPPPPT